jgi:hypothetical protein
VTTEVKPAQPAPTGGRQGKQKPLPPESTPSGNSKLVNGDCLKEMARRWYGYGRWDAPYWFIGPEPGQPGGKDLNERCSAWVDLGRGELVDCREHHLGFGWKDWHREAPPPPLQQTWKQLIRLLLATRTGEPPQAENIRSYQQKSWGMKNGETCVIELSSLAAPKLAAPGEHGLFRQERIREIHQKMLYHKPAFVVMYGVLQKVYWQEVAGGVFPPGDILQVGSTFTVFAKHPTVSVCPTPIGSKSPSRCANAVPVDRAQSPVALRSTAKGCPGPTRSGASPKFLPPSLPPIPLPGNQSCCGCRRRKAC